jgi:hypothetical protein
MREWTDGCLGIWMNLLKDGWMDVGWVDERIGGWMEGWNVRLMVG